MILIYVTSGSLSLPGTTVRRSGSSTVIANGRAGSSVIGQSASRISATNRNQLDPSPQELPVKDTDRAIDVASAECKNPLTASAFFILILFATVHDHLVTYQSVSMQDCEKRNLKMQHLFLYHLTDGRNRSLYLIDDFTLAVGTDKKLGKLKTPIENAVL